MPKFGQPRYGLVADFACATLELETGIAKDDVSKIVSRLVERGVMIGNWPS